MRKWSEILTDLQDDLDLDRVKVRSQGGAVLPYLEGDDVINNANRIFGEDGWDAFPLGEVQRFEVGVREKNNKQIVMYTYTVPYMVRFHGYLGDGETMHTIEKGDIGKNSTQSEAPAQHEMAISGCATDALKRAMRHLGRQFGITLYDKTSSDFQAIMQREKGGANTNAPRTQKSKPSKKPQKNETEEVKDESSLSGIQRAMAYVVPEELTVEGKPVRLPNAGKTVGDVLDDPMGDNLLVWLAGLRESPAKTPPFVAITKDETSLQNAVSYVLLNKRLDILSEEEKETLKERLKNK